MIVSMVDDRALRFQQMMQQALPPVVPESTPNPLEDLVNNFLRTSGQLAEDQVKYGGRVGGLGSRTADLLTSQGGVSDSPGLRAGALAGDILLDPGWLVPGVGAAKAGQTAGRTVNTYRGMSPQNQALYNSMLRGLYHGSRDTGTSVARPFDVVNRGQDSWSQNWFGGDMFGATGRNLLDPAGRQVAEGYTQSAVRNSIGRMPPGVTAEGFPITRGAKFRLSEPVENAANRKILDLTEGTLDQVDPVLYRRLVNEFADPDDVLDSSKDLAKMDLSAGRNSLGGFGGGLHQSSYSRDVRPILEEFGYDTIKHLSGQLQGDIVTPVYAFLNSAGLRATPTLPSPGRAFDFVDANLSNIAQQGAEVTGRAGAAIREGGASALDSLAAALQRPDMSSVPAPIRNFVENRTMARGSGEGMQDIRQFARNPQIDALLRRLGIDKLFPSNVGGGGLPRPAFDDL